MRVALLAIGRMKNGPERGLASRYFERARAQSKGLGLSGFTVSESAESRASSPAARMQEEARALERHIPQRAVTIALDERGRQMSSDRLARTIAEWRDAGRQNLCLIIGGADGLHPDIRERADLVLSFSPMTWPHQLVRIMVAEQLYRTTTILSGHPYHRGA